MIAASQSSYRWRSRPLSPEFQLEHSAGTLVHHPAAPPPTHSMLPSSDMSATPQFTTAAYGMAAVLAWGTSDFLGGYATRRANAFLFTVVVNIGGLLVVGTLTSATHAPIPSARSAAWVLVGGLSGGAALAIFYRALSSGRMGLTAPVAAVLGAAIPAVFSMYHEGLPGKIPLLGFFFAAIGLWLITRTEDGGPPEGIGLPSSRASASPVSICAFARPATLPLFGLRLSRGLEA